MDGKHGVLEREIMKAQLVNLNVDRAYRIEGHWYAKLVPGHHSITSTAGRPFIRRVYVDIDVDSTETVHMLCDVLLTMEGDGSLAHGR